MTKQILTRTAFLTALMLVANRSSAAIMIDPGPAGPAPNPLVIPVPELIGQVFDGSVLSLDFVFADMKHLEIEGSQVAVVLTLEHNAGALLGVDVDNAYLSDMNGNPVALSDLLVVFLDFSTIEIAYHFGTEIPLGDPFVFHDVHMTLGLPANPTASVTGAEISFAGSTTVGLWQPTAIPEPGSLAVWGLLVSLVIGLTWAKKR